MKKIQCAKGSVDQMLSQFKARLAELQGQDGEIESSFVYPEDMEALEDGEYESHVTEPIKSATRTLPDGTEYDPEDYADGYTEWEMVDTKQVKDSDGFWTDYTMWYNQFEDMYCFTFGDKDIYYPENADWDWECENEDEAWEWFNDYNGFEDEDEYDDEYDDEEYDEDIEECDNIMSGDGCKNCKDDDVEECDNLVTL